MNNIKLKKSNTNQDKLSKTQKVLYDLGNRKNDFEKSLWRKSGFDKDNESEELKKLIKSGNNFNIKIYKARIKGCPQLGSNAEQLKYSGKLSYESLLNYLGERENILEKVNKVQKFAYGMLFKTSENDIFINNPFLDEKIKTYKVVETIYSKLYQNDNSFIEKYKENNLKIENINDDLFNEIDEDKLSYYTGEFWQGMKTNVIIGDYTYKVHQDHDNKEFIVECAYSEKYDKFKRVIDFTPEEEYKLKRQLLYDNF